MSDERILLFIPAYSCAPQIGRVIAQLDPGVRALIDEAIVVDNQSPDDTQAEAIEALRKLDGLRWKLLRNDDNYGLGGSHKVAIEYGRANGFEWLLVLHGDDQADVHDIVGPLQQGEHRALDALLGARFMPGSRLHGYSRVRTLGNHVYNGLFSMVGRRGRLYDLGSGLNLFRLASFADGAHLRFADDLTFNYHLTLHMLAHGWRIRFLPISWREEDQRSNVKLVSQALRTLRMLGEYVRDREAFAATDHRPEGRTYTAQTVASSDDPG